MRLRSFSKKRLIIGSSGRRLATRTHIRRFGIAIESGFGGVVLLAPKMLCLEHRGMKAGIDYCAIKRHERGRDCGHHNDAAAEGKRY